MFLILSQRIRATIFKTSLVRCTFSHTHTHKWILVSEQTHKYLPLFPHANHNTWEELTTSACHILAICISLNDVQIGYLFVLLELKLKKMPLSSTIQYIINETGCYPPLFIFPGYYIVIYATHDLAAWMLLMVMMCSHEQKCLFFLPFLCSVQNRSRTQLYFMLFRSFNIKKLDIYWSCRKDYMLFFLFLHHKIHSVRKTISKKLVWVSAVCILARKPSSMVWSGTSVSSASVPEAAAP